MSRINHLVLVFLAFIFLFLQNKFIFLSNWWIICCLIILTSTFFMFKYVLKKNNYLILSAYTTLLSSIILLVILMVYSEHISKRLSHTENISIENTHHTKWGPSLSFHFKEKPVSKRLSSYKNFDNLPVDYCINVKYVEPLPDVFYIQRLELIQKDRNHK